MEKVDMVVEDIIKGLNSILQNCISITSENVLYFVELMYVNITHFSYLCFKLLDMKIGDASSGDIAKNTKYTISGGRCIPHGQGCWNTPSCCQGLRCIQFTMQRWLQWFTMQRIHGRCLT